MNFKKSKGFTLIEVLIAMVILAVGVLGLGVMQLSSLQNTQGGQMRTQASILAYDILDNMRANTPAVTAESYFLTFGDETPTAVDCYGADKDCTSTQIAASDLDNWRTAIASSLPGGNGQVFTADLGDRNMVAVFVSWTDPYNGGAQDQVFVLTELPQ